MANQIIVSVDQKKARRALKNIEKAEAYEFAEIVNRAYRPHPDEKDIQELRKWLDEHPDIWRLVFDIGHVIEKNLIKRVVTEQAAYLALEKNVDEIRHDLGYNEATAIEILLIDNVVLSWLRWQWAEYRLLMFMDQDEVSTSVTAFWEKRLSAAQGRYLRACETLAKIRRLPLKNPLFQVNIATQSGQQVNVAGDMVKK